MSEKQRLKNRLKYAMSAALAGRYEEAQHILDSVRVDADAALLGHETSIGLPRRLHSAFLRLAKAQHDVIRKTGYQFHLVPPVDVLNKYARFSIAERKRITQANRLAVPQKIHQIWIGEKTPPVTTAAWREHAEKQGYEYQLWQEDKLQELNLADNATFCDMLKKGDRPGAVDVARYTILQKFGGIYLDCDWYPARDDISFHDLLPMTGLTAMPEDIPRNTGKGCTLLANSFIATPPRHPVFTRLIAVLDDINKELPEAPAWWSTGPLIFTLMSRGGSVTLADADMVAGSLPQATSLAEVKRWCNSLSSEDGGFLLAWRSWERSSTGSTVLSQQVDDG